MNTLETKLEAVWIVVGQTGQYSDYQEWNVLAFTTEKEAVKCRDLCQSEADKVNGADYEIRDAFKSKYDPQFRTDYYGTSYRMEMVELRVKCPREIKDKPKLP